MIPVIIPARSGSSRFPNKPLAPILGREMVLHVCDAASRAVGQGQVFVATDSPDIASRVERSGYGAIMTSGLFHTGSDRVADAMKVLGVSKCINVQGDEPLVDADLIRKVRNKLDEPGAQVINCYSGLLESENEQRNSIPKVVVSQTQRLLYASRLPIPGRKDSVNRPSETNFLKQVCVYGYSLELLEGFGLDAVRTPLELKEDIEIVRFLELGVEVQMIEARSGSIAVDYPEDILLVESEMRKRDQAIS